MELPRKENFNSQILQGSYLCAKNVREEIEKRRSSPQYLGKGWINNFSNVIGGLTMANETLLLRFGELSPEIAKEISDLCIALSEKTQKIKLESVDKLNGTELEQQELLLIVDQIASLFEKGITE